MSKVLFIRDAVIKHVLGDTYPATTLVMEQNVPMLPIGFTVPDDKFDEVISVFNIGPSLIIDENGEYTSKYYEIKNAIPDFYNISLFARWGTGDDLSNKIISTFPNYNVITGHVSGSENNAVIVKGDYELYCDVANMSTIQGAYKNGSPIYFRVDVGTFVGYSCRTNLYIYNESFTRVDDVVLDPASYGGLAVGISSGGLSTAVPNEIQTMLKEITEQGEIPTDPYNPGGGSEPGGGGGDFDNTSTPVDIPDLPSISAADTGFISLFNPTIAQLQNLAGYLWSDLFDIEGWKKIFANPMDAILGLSLVPVSVPGNGARPVKVGNISTGISLTVAATQYVAVDCGTINVNEYWGAYLDYDPYTKAEIYLPYIGTHALSVDDIMGKTVHVVYHVDILSGACCAYVKCGESVLYSFVGQCSCSIPITGSDWTNVINGALSIAGAIGSMVATGGASAPMAIGTMASAAVNSLKPNVEKSGSMGGMGGMLGIQVPYLILTRPRQALPSNQNKYMGYPSFITVNLGECSGFTEIDTVHLEGIPATQAEISEIETLLKGGVIF